MAPLVINISGCGRSFIFKPGSYANSVPHETCDPAAALTLRHRIESARVGCLSLEKQGLQIATIRAPEG
jgi:hypothetical protein